MRYWRGRICKVLTNNDLSYPRPSVASEIHSHMSSSYRDKQSQRTVGCGQQPSYRKCKVGDASEHASRCYKEWHKEGEVQVDTDEAQPLLEDHWCQIIMNWRESELTIETAMIPYISMKNAIKYIAHSAIETLNRLCAPSNELSSYVSRIFWRFNARE